MSEPLHSRRDVLPVDEIVVGERRREDLGDISPLAQSIQQYGLLHPVVVDDENRLIAGERRLRAVQALGWNVVAIRVVGSLTESERREVELEENLRRKDLTPYERSRTVGRLIETARQVLLETPAEVVEEPTELRGDSPRNSPGRPRVPGSERDVAKRTGIPGKTRRDAERHVATADAYPFMQSPDWSQSQVLEARKLLEGVPNDTRPTVAAFIGAPGTPSHKAVLILKNYSAMPSPKQERLRALMTSSDEQEVSLARRTLTDMPPPMSGRSVELQLVITRLKAIRGMRMDRVTPMVQEAIACVERALEASNEVHEEWAQQAVAV